MLPVEVKPVYSDRLFPMPEDGEVRKMVASRGPIHAEQLLKFIHSKYGDEGLRMTLIHRLFRCCSSEIAYYVPELVYIAIKKDSKHMRKLLLYQAKNSESLKRLVLHVLCRSCGMSRPSQS